VHIRVFRLYRRNGFAGAENRYPIGKREDFIQFVRNNDQRKPALLQLVKEGKKPFRFGMGNNGRYFIEDKDAAVPKEQVDNGGVLPLTDGKAAYRPVEREIETPLAAEIEQAFTLRYGTDKRIVFRAQHAIFPDPEAGHKRRMLPHHAYAAMKRLFRGLETMFRSMYENTSA
jgi:hypothetical protein